MNLNDDPRGGTMCLTKAGLAIGDGAKTGPAIVSPVGAGIDFMIDGYLYHKADAATVLPLSADTAQGLLTNCLYTMCIDKDGTVTSVQGVPVLTADLVAGNDALFWPPATDGTAPFGGVRIAVTTTYNFTPGTTALDATGVTETYYDFGIVPVNPITA